MKKFPIFILMTLTIAFALEAWHFSPEPDVIAESLWDAFRICLKFLISRLASPKRD